MIDANKGRVSIKKYIWILYFLKKDTRVSKYAKIIIIITLAYALSPIDLIPDFIPILGLLDDLIIIPFGIYIAMKLIPNQVWNDCQQKALIAIDNKETLPKHWGVASIIILTWIVVLILFGRWLTKILD